VCVCVYVCVCVCVRVYDICIHTGSSAVLSCMHMITHVGGVVLSTVLGMPLLTLDHRYIAIGSERSPLDSGFYLHALFGGSERSPLDSGFCTRILVVVNVAHLTQVFARAFWWCNSAPKVQVIVAPSFFCRLYRSYKVTGTMCGLHICRPALF
jgi:hypothetical protein